MKKNDFNYLKIVAWLFIGLFSLALWSFFGVVFDLIY